jgi:predicted secreted Zn-dependent protease
MMRPLTGLKTVLACLLALTAASPALSKVIIHKKISYFTIGGSTPSELDQELNTRGPVSSQSGYRHPSVTRNEFAGTVTYITRNNRCTLSNPKILLSTHIILPRWTGRKSANKKMALIWDTLSSDIRRHEERHGEIARNHARAFERAVLALPPAKNCEILKQRVAEMGDQTLIDNDKDQQRFDRVEAANFDSRLSRLLKYRATGSTGQ